MTPGPFALTLTPKVLLGRRRLGLAFEHVYILPEQEQLSSVGDDLFISSQLKKPDLLTVWFLLV